MASFSDAEFRQFSEWLRAEYGLDFSQDRRDVLRARLDPARREAGFDSFSQLLFHLKYHPSRMQARDQVLRHLTNNESYFYREPVQLDLLRDDLLPGYRRELASGRRTRLRLMSAGCARGEEPYTLAMLLEDAGVKLDERIEILGVDVDSDALERARAGVFREHAFRRIPGGVRERHFEPLEGEFRIAEALRSAVRFRSANLVDAQTWSGVPQQDVILCRNVLIYFSEESALRAVRILHSVLAPGGYLFLGHAENLSRVPIRLETVRRPGTVFYRKPEE